MWNESADVSPADETNASGKLGCREHRITPDALRTDCISPGEHTPRDMDASDANVDMFASSSEVTETTLEKEQLPPTQADIELDATMQSPSFKHWN